MTAARVLPIIVAVSISMLFANAATAGVVQIGVSEYVYGDLAQQIGGSAVAITPLPGAEKGGVPQLDLIICDCSSKGAVRLDQAAQSQSAVVINVAHPQVSSFPWYDVRLMAEVSRRITAELTRRLPDQAQRITVDAAKSMAQFQSLDRRIGEVARDYANADVILADDWFRGMAERLRFKIQDEDVIKGRKLGTPLSGKSIAALRQAIQRRAGSIFIYDKDAASAVIEELAGVAQENGIPVVALRERLPKGLHYQQWMLRQINAVHGALNEASP